VEEKERNTVGWRMRRELVNHPMTGLISGQAACEIGRQQANCCQRLRRCKLRSRSDRWLRSSYTLLLTTRAVTIGLVTLELHGAAARGCLLLRDQTCPAQKEGHKDRDGKRQGLKSGEAAHVTPHTRNVTRASSQSQVSGGGGEGLGERRSVDDGKAPVSLRVSCDEPPKPANGARPGLGCFNLPAPLPASPS